MSFIRSLKDICLDQLVYKISHNSQYESNLTKISEDLREELFQRAQKKDIAIELPPHKKVIHVQVPLGLSEEKIKKKISEIIHVSTNRFMVKYKNHVLYGNDLNMETIDMSQPIHLSMEYHRYYAIQCAKLPTEENTPIPEVNQITEASCPPLSKKINQPHQPITDLVSEKKISVSLPDNKEAIEMKMPLGLNFGDIKRKISAATGIPSHEYNLNLNQHLLTEKELDTENFDLSKPLTLTLEYLKLNSESNLNMKKAKIK